MVTSEFSVAALKMQEAVTDASPIMIHSLAEADEHRWDSFVLRHAKASFFHQTAWKRVMEKTYGYRPFYFFSERAGRITGIAPAFLVSSWVTGRILVSLPFAVYGGICADDTESEKALISHLEQLAIEQEVEHLELRDRGGDLLPGYHPNSRHATFTIPLVADTEALYKGFPKDIRYMIRKGEKAGLVARCGFDQLDVFYRLMTINLRRLGTPAFPKRLFENLIHEYTKQVEVMVVYSSDKPVAGGMSFLFREWMQPYYVGSLDEAKGLAANNFLWWELIKLAALTGHKTFDFGRSKKESGNFDFKKKWNPAIESLNYQVRLVRRTEVPNFSPTNPKFEMATNLWKKLPLAVTRTLGPRVVRWFP